MKNIIFMFVLPLFAADMKSDTVMNTECDTTIVCKTTQIIRTYKVKSDTTVKIDTLRSQETKSKSSKRK